MTTHRNAGLYAIADKMANQIVGNISLMKSPGVATRWFTDVLRTPDTLPHVHPDDYDLHYLGELNDDLHIYGTPTIIMTGLSVRLANEAATKNQKTGDR